MTKITKTRTRTLALLYLVVSLLLISCTAQPIENIVIDDLANGEAPVVEIEPAEVVVTMSSNAFQPAQIIIDANTTVRWENTSTISHTVTSGTRGSPTGEFDVALGPGESFSYTFEEPGMIDYYCIPHPGMDGIVTVE